MCSTIHVTYTKMLNISAKDPFNFNTDPDPKTTL